MAGNRQDDRGYELDDTRSLASKASYEDDQLLEEDPLYPDEATEKIVRRRPYRYLWIPPLVIGLLIFLIYTTSRTSSIYLSKRRAGLRSNGTSNFRPTTILVSLDGFRADFLKRGLTPTLNAFIAEGVSPSYLLPSFPSVTFPNHFTLVTGLYPESHGIVGNTFWDPHLQDEFFYTNKSSSYQSKWWGGEPIWVTAERQGVKTGIHMWPGSEVDFGEFDPSYVDNYNGSETLSRKVDRILELLDLSGPAEHAAAAHDQRPQLIAAYVPNVDADGHKYGPNSTEIRDTIQKVDQMLHSLFTGLEERNLTNIVNMVVVSDHGMATTATERLIQLEDLIDVDLIEHIDGWPLYGLRPKDPKDLPDLYRRLSDEAAKNPNIDVYLRDENMPERYHFSNNDRIAPLWIVPKAGWAIVTKKDFDVQRAKEQGEVYHPMGLHGYDHEDPLMRAIFVARGPAFPHAPNSKLEIFQNIEVYNLICDSLSIAPIPNNGTLRLPLKPIGLHPDNGTESVAASLDANNSKEAKKPSIGVDPVEIAQSRPVIKEQKSKLNKIWHSVLGKLEEVKDWIGHVVSKDKKKEESAGKRIV